MPTLKQITCSLQLGPSDTKLKEYGHRFTDGGVEAFIAVPHTKIPFHVRVTSSGYIAPGLAAYVFMDGQYQCNRNRQRLQLPAPNTSARHYEVDFRLRQKEDKTADGTFVAREWTFAELQTGNADKAPDTNPAFAKNVGTIEVVILRCRGDAAHDPAETVIDGGDETGFAAMPGAPTVANSAPATKARSSAKPASKAPTKEPSAAADDGMGMFGLFDGAGDDPDYVRRMPGYYPDHSPLPRYRPDTRDDAHYSPRPFTVHGGHANRNAEDQREYRHDPRSKMANDNYPLPPTPRAVFDFQQRRRHVPESVQQSPMQRHNPRPYHPAYTAQAPPSTLLPQSSAPDGFSFILNICKEIDNLYRLSFGERQKCTELAQEAQGWENDPEMHLTAMKALRHKEQEIGRVDDELKVMYQSIYARLRRMDPKAWQYTRDFLVLEARLFSPNDPQMQQWPDPRQQQHPRSPEFGATQTSGAIDDHTGPSPRSDDGWEEQGQGRTSGGLHQRQLRKQSGTRSAVSAQKSAGDGWGAKSQQGNDNWGVQDAVDQQANDDNQGGDGNANDGGGWGAEGGSNKRDDANKAELKKDDVDNWGGNDNAGPSQDIDGWGTNANNNDPKQDDDWDQQKGDSSKDEPWPNNNDGAASQKSASQKGDDWARGGDDKAQQGTSWGDKKSQTGKSKIDGWADGSKKPQAAGGWGQQSNARSRGGGGGWEEAGAGEAQARSRALSRRPARTTTSVALEPVIKPYWADWNKPQQDMTRPRVQPRDPYEYPRAATVLAPAGKARDVSHGVQAGRGAHYSHKTFRPEYIDSMDKPYAIFTFKYRSQAALEKILKRKIDTGDTKRAVDESEKEKLMRLPKDELVKEMLKMRLNPPRSSSKPASAAKAPSNTGWGDRAPSQANRWGGDQQRDEIKPGDSISAVSVKHSNGGGGGWGADDKKASSRKSKADGSGWGANAGNNNNGGDAWGNDEKSRAKSDKKVEAQKAKSKASAWDAAPAAGGGGGGNDWQADNAGKGQDKASSKSEAHFDGDPNLKTAGNAEEVGAWENAGW